MAALLNWMIWLPLIGAAVCLVVPDQRAAKWVALMTSVLVFVMNIVLAAAYAHLGWTGVHFETAVSWISSINVQYRVAVDGLSLPLLLLTTGLSVLVVAASWSITKLPSFHGAVSAALDRNVGRLLCHRPVPVLCLL